MAWTWTLYEDVISYWKREPIPACQVTLPIAVQVLPMVSSKFPWRALCWGELRPPDLHRKTRARFGTFAEHLNPYPAFCEPLTGSDNSYLFNNKQKTSQQRKVIQFQSSSSRFPIFCWRFWLQTTEKKSTGSVSDSETFFQDPFLPKWEVMFLPTSRCIEQNFTKICYKWLVQPGSNFSICSVIFLRFGGEATHPAGLQTPPNDFYTKQIPTAWNTGQPEDFYTRIPFRFSNAYSMSMFNWFHLFPHHFLTLAHRTKHYPLESFLFNILIHIFSVSLLGISRIGTEAKNNLPWWLCQESSQQVTHVIPLTRLWLQKKSCSTKKKTHPSKSHFV